METALRRGATSGIGNMPESPRAIRNPRPMNSTVTHTLLHWLPADSRAGVCRRFVVVWAVAFFVGLLQWFMGPHEQTFAASLVYSYAISTSIWFLADPMRIATRCWMGAQEPHNWTPSVRTAVHMLLSVVLGYSLGTTLGDAYSGQSTWSQMAHSPQRFWSVVLISVGISLGFLFYFYQRAQSQVLRQQATEARLKLLETQLEPHMLFNTLANLRALIATDPPRAIHMLDRLNDYLRATLRGSRTMPAVNTHTSQTSHTLADECTRLSDYLELMAVRMGARLAYAFEIPDALQHHPVPPLLLQPLLENAIRHGLEPRVQGGAITVRASRGAGHLVIEVADTGVGMSNQELPADFLYGFVVKRRTRREPQTVLRHGKATQRSDTFEGETAVADHGFGLAQVRERVASLPAGRAGLGRVEVISTPGQGTTIRLQLPWLDHTSAP